MLLLIKFNDIDKNLWYIIKLLVENILEEQSEKTKKYNNIKYVNSYG